MASAPDPNRLRGAWYGVFVGDALGTTLEFSPKPMRRAYAERWHTDITGGGPFGLEAGDWTDDGAMTLCLARALAEDEPPTMDRRHQLEHYLRWREEGWCSSNGRCFDIGNQTREALDAFERNGAVVAPAAPDKQGNGALMRAVPVPIWLTRWQADASLAAGKPVRQAVDLLAEKMRTRGLKVTTADDQRFRARAVLFADACLTTHNSRVCAIANVIYSEMVYQCLYGCGKPGLLATGAALTEAVLRTDPEFDLVYRALTRTMVWEDFDPTGWVVNSLAMACWALRAFDTFEEGMLEVVNLRGDADTNCAIYGGLAGSLYGDDAIPERWLGKLKRREELEEAFAGLATSR